MNVPPSELAAVHLDRSDDHECLLDNLRRARTLAEQKKILALWEAGITAAYDTKRLQRRLSEMLS